ncbi:colanic acid/amylovoran biosynthesis glycosyltransferase [Salinibacter ruber]|uniref:glycosyltransferase n=1 Tax=Salinibacter ruber TaxID=146919 RepID=UPI002169E05F|nr:glycosyltransferase [Salinibacter ruber]MCS4034708.1 colanic acid/amylovoran biosynthesis glycosyltransferase [Salinibacter ruber]
MADLQSQQELEVPPSLEEAPTIVHDTGTYVHASENWIHTQVLYLRAHSPFVFCGQLKNLDRLEWVPPYYKTFDRSLPIRAVDRLGLNMLGYRPALRWQLHRREAELLHVHFGNRGYEKIALADKHGIPLVTSFYGFDLSLLPRLDPKWIDRYNLLFDRGHRFLVEGPHMKEQLAELGCPEDKISVQHLGIEVDAFSYRPRCRQKSDPLRVLAAGRFKEKKGFPDALRAFGAFLERGGKGQFTIVGGLRDDEQEHDAREQLKEIVRSEGIESDVVFRSFLPHDELIDAFHEHHVLLSPSIEASDGDNEGGAPVTLIEAAATGMPIVSTRHCDIPEVVKHSRTGLLAEEGNVDELSRHLYDLYESSGRLESMGKKAREHVCKQHDAKKQGRRLDKIYEQIWT